MKRIFSAEESSANSSKKGCGNKKQAKLSYGNLATITITPPMQNGSYK